MPPPTLSAPFSKAIVTYMIYQGNNQFSLLSNRFDWNIETPLFTNGNAGTLLGAIVNYNIWTGSPLLMFIPAIFGGPYDINFVGTATILK
jgi:hypothetical protein